MKKQRYHCGLALSCPVDQVTAGGETFVKRSEKVSGWGANTKRTEVQGSIHYFSEEDLARVKAAAAKKIVRVQRGRDGSVQRATMHRLPEALLRPRRDANGELVYGRRKKGPGGHVTDDWEREKDGSIARVYASDPRAELIYEPLLDPTGQPRLCAGAGYTPVPGDEPVGRWITIRQADRDPYQDEEVLGETLLPATPASA